MAEERILIVDDEPEIVRFCSRALTRQSYAVEGVTSGQEAVACLEAEPFDLLIVDIRMPDVDGLAILRRGRELNPNLTAVVITGYATLDSAIEALNSGARGFVLKPFGVQEFTSAVEEALAQRRKEQERLHLRAQLPILEISQALMADGDVESLTRQLLEIVARQMGADRAALMLLDEEAEELYVAHSLGLPVETVGGRRIPLGQSVAGRAIQGQEPVVVATKSLADLDPSWQMLSAGADVTVAYVPLRARKRTIGLLGLSRVPGGAPFLPTDLNLLSIMGGQIATALDNARLYQKLRASRDYTQTVLDSLHDAVMVVNRDYTIADVNVAFMRKMGYRKEEVVGHRCHQVSHQRDEPCDGPDHPCPVVQVWRTGHPARSVHIHYDKLGERLHIDVAVSPLLDEQGQVVQAIEAYRDVTAERRLETSLAAIRALGQELVLSRNETQIAQVVVEIAERVLAFGVCDLWLVDEEQRMLVRQASTAAAKAVDIPPLPLDSESGITAAVARSGETAYLPDVRQDPRFLDTGMHSHSELCVPLMAGERVVGVLNAESEKVNAFDEAAQRLFSTLANQASLALENARLFGEINRLKEFNEGLVQNMMEGIAVEDAEGTFIFFNPAGAAMLGYESEELMGRHWTEVIPPDQHGIVRQANKRRLQGKSDRYELVLQRRDGSHLPVLVAGRPLFEEGCFVGSLAVFSNLTEVKRLQDQLIQSEKLAALGRLAASLAHEINNPLQALRSGLGLLVNRPVEREKRQHYLEVASREVERLITITERMLNFYRPSPERRGLIDVNDVLDETLALADKKLQHSQVILGRKLLPHLPLVEAVADQLKQVFLNIVLNALDAMSHGGKLTVETGWDARRREVWIAFADTGEGIPADEIPRIFEPFYTTKPKGSGLGLAISYGIVEGHGGRIDVQSQVDAGSTFTVFLPTTEGLSRS